MMRLQKYLAHAGVCSRRKGEEWIAQGRITVNGQVSTRPGIRVDPASDQVCVEGRPVSLPDKESRVYIMLNKPPGVITSCSRQGKDPIVLDLVPAGRRVYPVGRLDKASCGLLLLTDDGELHQRLSHPSHDHEKEYRVTTAHPLPARALDAMARGMVLDGKKTRRAMVDPRGERTFHITLKQGINRQIRRMVGQAGGRVVHLKRIRIGALKLGRLAEGRWRHLSQAELNALKKEGGTQRPPSKRTK